MWDNATITMLLEGTRDTLYMTLVSTFFGYVLGLPLGILLAVTDKEGIHPNSAVYKVLDVIVNILRSIPFLILLILVFSVLADIMTLRFAFSQHWDMKKFTGFAGGPITCYLLFLIFALLLILGYGLFCILDFFNGIDTKEGSTLFSFLIDTGFFNYLL